jgi:predicted small metal-binding protein
MGSIPDPREDKESAMTKRVECECGWSHETDSEEDLVSAVQRHAREVHNMEGVTRDQVLAQAKPA